MYMSIHVSGFPNWDIVMRGQTYRRERQVYLYTCHGFVGWITSFVTTSAYVKHINGFKIIWRYLTSKYKDIIRKTYFTVDYLKEYVIWHFTFRKKDQVGEQLFNTCNSPQRSSFVVIFAHFCISFLFLCYCIYWEPLKCFTSILLQIFLVLPQGLPR